MSIESRLTAALGKEKVAASPAVRQMYAYDSSPFISAPDLVVFPESTEDAARVMALAAAEGIPVVPRGAGTNISGGSVPVTGGISLVTTRMNSVLEIDPLNRTALVEPGVVNLDLQRALAPHGLFFPPDPASQKAATIGGNVAECAGGIQGVKYGVTKNYVLGLELVLSDGAITTTGLLSADETLGPDTTGIFNGSEGAFALMTKILVRCIPKAQAVRTALAAFPGLDNAANAVSAIIKQGIVPTALELMDQAMLRAVDDYIGVGFPTDAEAVLLLEVDGYEVDLDRQLGLMVEICRNNGAGDVRQAADDMEREKLWKARRSGNGALGRIRPAYMVHDVTVPRHHLTRLLAEIRDIGEDNNIIITQMAHAGDGNAHPHLLYYPDEENIQEKLHKTSEEIFKAALALGGTITGEHGIGLEKKDYMGMQFSRAELDYMSKIKNIMDPKGILNPGKIFPECTPNTGKQIESGDVSNNIAEKKPGAVPDIDSDGNILCFYPDNLSIQVSGETPFYAVRNKAAEINAFLPLCPYTQGKFTMDHLIETGAYGYGAMAYGSLKEYIYGLDFTIPSGEKISTGGHTAKNVAGFDFTRLFWISGKAFGEIKSVTLKLLPCPEKEQFIVRAYSSLKDCLAAAESILKTKTCLCTLKAVGRKRGWELITGLSGSTAAVDAHTQNILSLLGSRNAGLQVFGPDDLGAFLVRDALDRDSYGISLLQGRGLRSPMFKLLSGHDHAFKNPGPCRVDLDIGYPNLGVFGPSRAALKESSLAGLSAAAGEFYMEESGKIRTSEVFKRLERLRCSN